MPEQRIDASLERADHRADAMPLEQPAPVAGVPLAARIALHLELAGADVGGTPMLIIV
jgi:hypothetical protein